jgi:excisionase family DNA binding protein
MNLITTEEAAKLCRISIRTMEAWRLSGHGPVYRKVGRLVFYTQSDVNAWLDANKRQSTSDTGHTELR